MPQCIVSLNIGDGPDLRSARGVYVERVVEGFNGQLQVLAKAATPKPLRTDGAFSQVALERGVTYRFRVPGVGEWIKLVPDAASATFDTLIEVVPNPVAPTPTGAQIAEDIAAQMVGNYLPIDGTVAPVGTALRVGSYNIRMSTITEDIGVAGRQWSDRKARCASDALASGAPIIGLQEVANSSSSSGQGAELVAAMNTQLGQPDRWATTLRGANPTIYDTTLVTRVPSTSTSQMLNPSIGQRYLTADQWTYAGKTFTLASLHNHHQAEVVGGTRRSISWLHAEALDQILAWFAAQTGPVVVVGDFNADRRLPLPQLRDAGLLAARDTAPVVQRAEFPTTNAFSATPTKVGRWLDHVLAGPGVAVVEAGMVLTFASGNDYPLLTPLASDHHCVWADLLIA